MSFAVAVIRSCFSPADANFAAGNAERRLCTSAPLRAVRSAITSIVGWPGFRTSIPCNTWRIACTSAAGATTISAFACSSSRSDAPGKSGRSSAAARFADTIVSGNTMGAVAAPFAVATALRSMSYMPSRSRYVAPSGSRIACSAWASVTSCRSTLT
jgi:hypothetical protein